MSNDVASDRLDAPRTTGKLPPFLLLDFWRGVASLGVVGYHWGELALRRFPSLEGHWLYALSKFGFLGVQLFFVISGYCIVASAIGVGRRGEGLPTYALARVRRIYPTYWVGLILAVLFVLGSQWLAAMGLVNGNIFTTTNLTTKPFLYYFSNLTLTMVPFRQPSQVEVAWTLCYEVAFYAIVGVALWVAQRTKKSERLLPFLHGLTLVTLIMAVFIPRVRLFPLDLWPEFGLGVVLFHLIYQPTDLKVRAWASAILGTTLLVALIKDTPLGWTSTSSRLQFSVAGLFTLFLFLTHRFDAKWIKNRVIAFLAWIGLFSYSLYLTHALTIRVVSLVIQKLNLPIAVHYGAYVAAVIVAVGAAYVFFLLFEKPVINWGKQRKRAEKEPVKEAVLSGAGQTRSISPDQSTGISG